MREVTRNIGQTLLSCILGCIFVCIFACIFGCGEDLPQSQERSAPDHDESERVRQAVCDQDWETAARKGSGAEIENASLLWSVSPYHLLVPSTGEGDTKLNIDAPHYDWLIYTTADVELESVDAPSLTLNGPLERCPELQLVEYYAHHETRSEWHLRLRGAGMSRALFYAGLVRTDHSDPSDAGHASHLFEDQDDAEHEHHDHEHGAEPEHRNHEH